MRIASGTIASAAVVALLSPMMAQPAHAQRAVRQSQVSGITILVRNIDDKSDAARVQAGGTFDVTEGTHVRVNVEAQLAGSRAPLYPVTEFTDLNRGGIRITRGNAANAAVDLEILPMRNPNRIQRIGYRITDNRVPADMRSGSFNIQVTAANRRGSLPAGGYDQPGGRPGYGEDHRDHGDHDGRGAWSGERARDLTRVLYQGILMREPDPDASGTTNAIRDGGYSALVTAAVNIANSNESRVSISLKGVTPEQRLQSMYQSLLGLSPQQADPNTWRSDLRALHDGHIAQVAEGIVRSDRFRTHFNITGY
ncbi:MAG TPA: hypothetical protein VGG20_07125 [Thermoanaerobaculia bacterium]|jgi:hypothetical protein